MNTTLKDLIKSTVDGFILLNTEFSVYDVTTSIRTLVNSGAVAVPELSVLGQSFQYEVDHRRVKSLFQQLDSNNEFSQILNRQWNSQGYFVYNGDGNSTSVPVPTVPTVVFK